MSNEDDNQNLPKSNKNTGRSTPEIRYIPIDIQAVENDEGILDFYEVLRTIWDGRKTIIKTVAIFIFLGLFVALVAVKEYTADVQLIPESDDGFSLGALGGLAQQFGFSAALSQQGGDDISVSLYPSIIKSNVFLAELMEYQVTLFDNAEQVSLEQYFREHQKKSIFGIFLKYTIKLPLTIKEWIFKNEDTELTSVDRTHANEEKLNRLTRMSFEEWEILRNIGDRISTYMNTETGVFTVSVKLQDPIIAADVADEVVQMLSKYIIDKRTEKARRELDFIEERFEEVKIRFEQAQLELAKFNDENRGQLTATARTEEQLLQSRYDLNFNLYNSMAQRLEEAKIRLQEETPVLNIIEPAAIPEERSEPKRILIVIVYTMLGGFVGLGIIFGIPYWERVKTELN